MLDSFHTLRSHGKQLQFDGLSHIICHQQILYLLYCLSRCSRSISDEMNESTRPAIHNRSRFVMSNTRYPGHPQSNQPISALPRQPNFFGFNFLVIGDLPATDATLVVPPAVSDCIKIELNSSWPLHCSSIMGTARRAENVGCSGKEVASIATFSICYFQCLLSADYAKRFLRVLSRRFRSES
jgi:hypothetical protein